MRVESKVVPRPLARALSTLRDLRTLPVVTNSTMLFITTMLNAALGAVFWTLSARLYGVGAVGFTTALAATASLVATGSNVGLGPIVLRFAPVLGDRVWRLCLLALLLPAMIALIVTLGLLMGPFNLTITTILRGQTPFLTVVDVLLVVATALMLVQDNICIARRQARLVLLRNVGSSAAQFALLVPCLRWGSAGLVLAFASGTLASVALGASTWLRPKPELVQQPVRLGQMARYGATSYLSGLLSQTPQLLYPGLIAVHVGHRAAGAWAFAWMSTALLMALAPSVANVLLTQAVRQATTATTDLRRTARIVVSGTAVLGGIAMLVVPVFAHFVLPQATREITVFLPLLLVSAVAYAHIRLRSMEFALKGHLGSHLVLNGAVALTAVGLPLLWLPHWGILGLEAGWLVSQLVGVVSARLLRLRLVPPALAVPSVSTQP